MELRVKPRYYLISFTVIIVAVVLFFAKPGKSFRFQNSTQERIDHSLLSELLENYVDTAGFVDYEGFLEAESLLNDYLHQLENTPPDENNWTEAEQLAYWINAYNAYTIKLVLDHYPISSIKDIGSSIQIPFVNSPWDISFIEIGGESLTLNDIEHRILRKEFNEPRIHFAIVCASISCPILRREAFNAQGLEEQLQEQAMAFINDSSKNAISREEIRLSRIFYWFGGDFKKKGTLIEYLNQYSKINISPETEQNFIDYNWGLNIQKGTGSGAGS